MKTTDGLVFLKDFYKTGHHRQYPANTTLIFSNFTPRSSNIPGIKGSVFFGLKYFIKKYLEFTKFQINTVAGYQAINAQCLGIMDYPQHIKDLQDYVEENNSFPIAIYAVPEGTFVPEKCPALVVFNTDPRFAWFTNAIETIMSATLWGACTSATIARQYRIILDQYASETSSNPEFVDYQGHDFSFRGMFGLEAAIISGMAHLQYFKGTDTIPAVLGMDEYYGGGRGNSVPATEHSVMCAGGKENEFETIKRLITEVYPSGPISIVCDTWDFWNVIDNFLPRLKDIIMARDGKVIIRPDSGFPYDIICGQHKLSYKRKGLIQSLWDIFGGTINDKGYKELDPHIGAIYGDGISLERCKDICQGLKEQGFASTNLVFGIGSYSYQYNTRDTLGWAMKATYAEIGGNPVELFKDPATDDGTKRSLKGLIKVIRKKDGTFEAVQGINWQEFFADDNCLELAYGFDVSQYRCPQIAKTLIYSKPNSYKEDVT